MQKPKGDIYILLVAESGNGVHHGTDLLLVAAPAIVVVVASGHSDEARRKAT